MHILAHFDTTPDFFTFKLFFNFTKILKFSK